MCVPVDGGNGASVDGNGMLGQGLEDLNETRLELVAEVMKAPNRRVDNAVTRLGDNAGLLEMHGRVMKQVLEQYRKVKFRGRMEVGGLVATGFMAAGGVMAMGLPPVAAGVGGMSIVGGVGLGIMNGRKAEDEEIRLLSEEGLGECFRRVYSRRVSEGDEELASCWERVRGGLRDNLKAQGLDNVEGVGEGDLGRLTKILEEKIPELRRMASTRMSSAAGSVETSAETSVETSVVDGKDL